MNKHRFQWLRAALIASIALLGSACVNVRYDVERLTDATLVSHDSAAAEHFARREQLTARILALAPDVAQAEAQRLAQVALEYPMRLASDYQLTQPAITHNVLVNLGMRPRGLCIHWTEDMLYELATLNLQTLDLYWGVAYPTNPFRLEHSSPVVTAKGQPFDSGLLLDAWRNSGELYFGPVADDPRYQWERLHNYITDPPPAQQ